MEFTVKRHEAIVAVIDLSKYLRRQLTIRYDTICNYLTTLSSYHENTKLKIILKETKTEEDEKSEKNCQEFVSRVVWWVRYLTQN